MTNDEKIEMIERQLVEVLAKLAECERKLTWLSTPRQYDSEIEPILCPVCNGAIDDHRANCKVEARQELTLWQRNADLERKLAAAREALNAADVLAKRLRKIHDNPEYLSVWEIAQLHNGPYLGPMYDTELALLEDRLAALTEAGEQR